MVCSSVLPLGATIAHFVYSEVEVDCCESWWAGLSIFDLVSLCNLIIFFIKHLFHKLLLFSVLNVLQMFLILINTWFSVVLMHSKWWFPRTLVTISKSINQDLWVTILRLEFSELTWACTSTLMGNYILHAFEGQTGIVGGCLCRRRRSECENMSLEFGVSCLSQPLRNKAFEQI